MNETMTFGDWLRQRRKALDLTQEQLADRVSCSHETIRKIEAGTRRHSREMVELLAQRLAVPPEERPALVECIFQRAELRKHLHRWSLAEPSRHSGIYRCVDPPGPCKG